MPRGYRRVVIAALGCLIAAAPLPTKNEHTDERRQHADATTHKAQAAPPTAGPTPNAEKPDGAQGQCVGTDKPHLSCEAVSAQAAIDQASDADRGTIIAGVQALVGVLTLFAAGAAAYYAKEAATFTGDAASHADTSARAARESLDHTRQTSAMALRPVLAIEAAQTGRESADARWSILVKIKNYGQTAAVKVSISLNCGTRTWPPMEAINIPSVGPIPETTLGAQQSTRVILDASEFEAAVPIVRAGHIAIFAHIVMTYEGLDEAKYIFDEMLVGNGAEYTEGRLRIYNRAKHAAQN